MFKSRNEYHSVPLRVAVGVTPTFEINLQCLRPNTLCQVNIKVCETCGLKSHPLIVEPMRTSVQMVGGIPSECSKISHEFTRKGQISSFLRRFSDVLKHKPKCARNLNFLSELYSSDAYLSETLQSKQAFTYMKKKIVKLKAKP